jgi:hypothetical protein
MFIFVAREPRPDSGYWPGRRLLTAVDAVAWPLLGIYTLQTAGEPTRLFGSVAAAVLMLVALSRLRTAICMNIRYRFTSWFALKLFGLLMALGLALKLFLH